MFTESITRSFSPRDSLFTKQSKALAALFDDLEYLDVWRTLNPHQNKFTFFSHPHKCHSRIHYFFVPKTIMHAISRCNIGDIVISDHATVVLDVCVKGFLRPVKSWIFNNLLLKDDKFLSYFNSEFKIFLSINSESTNNPSLLWETTKAYIRGLVISYSATKKRKQLEKEKHVESELNTATSSYLDDPYPALLEKISAVRASLNSLLTHQSHSYIIYLKQKLYEWGNKPSPDLTHNLLLL